MSFADTATLVINSFAIVLLSLFVGFVCGVLSHAKVSRPTKRAADGAEVAPENGVYYVEWVDADTIRLTPRR